MAENSLTSPSLMGVMRESENYRYMGLGFTDRVFLLGHGDGLEINDPYQVISLPEAINKLNAQSDLPLLRSMLHTYSAGCRDIFLLRVAPSVEYVVPQADRLLVSNSVVGKTYAEMIATDPTYTIPSGLSVGAWSALTFYERYKIRLDNSYAILLDWDSPQIMVPLEAPFYDAGGVDFLTPLAQHCEAAFLRTGAVRMAFLGSKTSNSTISAADIQTIKVDARLNNLGSSGKYVALFSGEGSFNFREGTTVYTGSPVHVLAGALSVTPLNMSLTYKQMRNVINILGEDLKADKIKELCELKINPLIRTSIGKRGRPFQAVVASDNTLAQTGSDFWATGHTRMIMLTIEQLRAIGRRYLGEVGYGQFKQEVQQYFFSMVANNIIRDFNLKVERSEDKLTAIVDVGIRPFFGIRSIYFTAEVGPEL